MRRTQPQGEAAQPARDRGSRARAASLLLLRDGAHPRADPSAVRRRRDLLERGRALQHRADAPGAGGEEGRRRRRRHAARVLHHHRDRRHRHGARGHEVLAALARGDRRFGRADHARPRLRRAGRARRLRQVAARHDDGDVPAQRAVDLHLWRLDPARHLQGPAGHHSGRVRGGRQAFGRRDVGRRSRRRSSSNACPSAGACGAQFTANTMATVSEAIGLALPYSAGAPAPYEIRDALLHDRRRAGGRA